MGQNDIPADVQILLEEYRTLRAEIIKRVQLGINYTSWFGVIGSIILGIGVQYDVNLVFVFMPFIINVLIAVDIASRTNILFLGAHLGALERRINCLMGKELLLWEHTLPFARVGADFWLRCPQTSKRVLNPLICRYPTTIIMVSLIYFFSVIKGFVYLHEEVAPMLIGWLFLIITSAIFLYLFIMTLVGVRKVPELYDHLIASEWNRRQPKQ